MKIGLFLGNMSPTDGGAYTLLIDQLSALRQLQGIGKHDIVLLHDQSGIGLAEQFSEFPRLNVAATKFQVSTQSEVDEILAREAAEAQRRIDDFERRHQRLKRISDFLARGYNALYSPLIDTTPSAPAEPASPVPADVATEPLQKKSIYEREGIQFIIYLAPWLGEIEMDVPYAVFVWDLQHRENPWFPEVSSGTEWDRREQNYAVMLRRAAVIYTGTEEGRKQLALYYQIAPERIHILPFATPGFALEAASQPYEKKSALAALDLPAEYLFYPAQFWSHKNHVMVLEACRIIREEAGWDLGVVFTGSDKGNLGYVQDYARRLGLEGCTRFLGFVDKTHVPDLYRGAACLAFPTFFGPDNLPPLEAFALGCPVVASDIPGASEQLGDAAILVSPIDERAWVKAILSLREVAARDRLVTAGHKAAAALNWDDYAQNMIGAVERFSAIRRTWA
jgi:glycosyltransferase involved in cell wall biosynthesis